MDISKYRIYLAKGRSLAVVRDCQKMMTERSNEMAALAQEVGAKNCVTKHSVVGFIFDDGAPEGWKRKGYVNGKPYFAPERRKKADRTLWDKMRALKPACSEDFSHMIGRDMVFTDEAGGPHGSTVLRWTTFQIVGGEPLIFVPVHDKDETPPPDAEPLKASDYWLMRERADAA